MKNLQYNKDSKFTYFCLFEAKDRNNQETTEKQAKEKKHLRGNTNGQ